MALHRETVKSKACKSFLYEPSYPANTYMELAWTTAEWLCRALGALGVPLPSTSLQAMEEKSNEKRRLSRDCPSKPPWT